MRAAARKSGEATSAPLTVSQLNALIRAAVTGVFPQRIHVIGEISNLSRPTSGHLYFTLKDSQAEMRAVMWRSEATAMKFRLENGLSVVVTATVDVYEPRGQVQLHVHRVEPSGVGALELAFRQLKERLSREGLFETARKRRLPPYPRRIAVVTSPTGAALRDILQTIRRRYPAVHVLVFAVRVQGEGAAEEIAAAIRMLDAHSAALGGIDVMIVGRGGGSQEDLWAFNEEIVARAIFTSRIPIVSAVGHEVDFTIADFVADVRAATPTAAAELVVPLLAEVNSGLAMLERRMSRAVRGGFELAASRLATAMRSEWFRDPIGRIRQRQQQLDETSGRLRLLALRGVAAARSALHRREVGMQSARPEAVVSRARERLARGEHRLFWGQGHINVMSERRLAATVAQLFQASPRRLAEREGEWLKQVGGRLRRAAAVLLMARRRYLEALTTRLDAGSHEHVLRRGFSITRRAKDRKLVRGPRDARVDERIVTQTAEGEIRSRVLDARQGEFFE